jgi:periplasmic protein TonB
VRAWLWGSAAAVSVTAHVAFAAWALAREPAPRTPVRPPVVMELAAIAKPKPVEPPKPPPPPPPPPPKPVTIKKVAKHAPSAPPPPSAPKVGIDAPETPGGLAVPTGETPDGDPNADGQGTEPAPPAPAAPPAPLAPPAPPAKKFVPIYEVTQVPRAKHRVEPEIPEAFRRAQREALVVIEVEIDVHGKVTGARVLRHAEYGLDDAALAAAKQTEFEPALMGTTPVAVRYQIPYRFQVRG